MCVRKIARQSLSYGFGLCLLSACSQPTTRANLSDFELLHQGQINAKDNRPFIQCLTDGFANVDDKLTASVKQQLRSDGYRVEFYTGFFLRLSADIFDNGRVSLYQNENPAVTLHYDMPSRRKAYSDCFEKFGGKTDFQCNPDAPDASPCPDGFGKVK